MISQKSPHMQFIIHFPVYMYTEINPGEKVQKVAKNAIIVVI